MWIERKSAKYQGDMTKVARVFKKIIFEIRLKTDITQLFLVKFASLQVSYSDYIAMARYLEPRLLKQSPFREGEHGINEWENETDEPNPLVSTFIECKRSD